MRRSADFWIALVLLAFCGIAAFLTTSVPDAGVGTKFGPSFFPWVMIIGITLLSLGLLARSFGKTTAKTVNNDQSSKAAYVKMGVFFLLMFLYATFYISAGYLIGTGIFFILAMLILGERRPLHVVIVPAGIIIGVFLVFTKVMQVYLP